MLIHLHIQTKTTPKIRAEIQASDEPAWVLAERFGTTEQTVWKCHTNRTVICRQCRHQLVEIVELFHDGQTSPTLLARNRDRNLMARL